MQEEKPCLLVIIAVTAQDNKELIAVDDGDSESTKSWDELLQRLK